MLAYLQDRAEDRDGDQVLIILPLSRDYAEAAKSAVGSDATRYDVLAKQIDQRKYTIKVLVQ